MKRLAGAVCLILFMAYGSAAAQELDGKWYGSLNSSSSDGETRNTKVYMVLMQNGAELTGTFGPSPNKQFAIQNGKIVGNKLTFDLPNEVNGGAGAHFTLTLVNGGLKGEFKAENRDRKISIHAAVDMRRITSAPEEQEIADAEKKVLEEEIAQKAEMVKVLGAKFSFETKLVKGAPYSATAEAETIQPLADGNRISSKTTTVVYRDSEGRTRRESPARKQGLPPEIFISDPAAGVNYVLEPVNRTAIKVEFHAKDLEKMQIGMKLEEAKQQEMKRRTSESVPVVRTEEGVAIKSQPLNESLGKQMIEGVECEGTRTTVTIAAGRVGNDLPIKIVREQWYSPELQVLVMTRQHDPRSGETTYRLTNINRSEPDRSLFEVPGDYKVEMETVKGPMKMKSPAKPEEEQ